MRNKVLIIEDDPSTHQMISDILEINGYEAIIAREPLDGLKKAISEKPDMILLDIMMPEMNGLEVCQRLKKDPITSKIPVICVSVKAAEEDIKAGKDAGAEDYITKPFIPKNLVETVKKHM